MSSEFKIATLNVRSFRSAVRAQTVLTYLGTVEADVICLQECSLPFRSSYEEWKRRWPHGPSFWSGSEENRADSVTVLVQGR